MKQHVSPEHQSRLATRPQYNSSRYSLLLTPVRCDGNKQDNKPPREITNNERVMTNLAAGALAGAVAKTTIAPLDRSKIYFQTSSESRFSFRNVVRFMYKTYKSTGFTSLWRGNSATMARIIPYAAIQFTAHEHFKLHILGAHESPPEALRFLCGALAGITAQTLTYPLDLTRARLAITPPSQYTSLADVFVKTVRREGPLGLYKGYVPTMMGVIPYAGCSFYCYEAFKRLWTREFGPGSVGGFERLCFGAIAGIIGQSSSYPLDIVRRRLQTGVLNYEPTGAFKVLRMMGNIARREGIVGGLYKGLSMNWIKGPVAAGISFAMFDWSRELFTDWIRV